MSAAPVTEGRQSKLATVHEGSSHTLNTQFRSVYNQSNELATMQSIFTWGWSSLGHRKSTEHYWLLGCHCLLFEKLLTSCSVYGTK